MKDSAFKNIEGFVSLNGEKLCRKVSNKQEKSYSLFTESGLYKKLLEKKYIVQFEETEKEKDKNSYKQILQTVPAYYSYAYEWSFSQLKDAALLLLSAQKLALEHNMTVNSAKCENIQFFGGKPYIFDTLIFEKYEEGTNWKAYEEFCKMFLAPLAIMSYTDVRLGQLLKTYKNGIPLDLACHILPITANLHMGLVTHIFKHAKRIKEKELNIEKQPNKVKKQQIEQVKETLKSLSDCVKSLSFPEEKNEWGNYYKHTSYSDKAFFAKKEIITNYLDITKPKLVFDIGSNRGKFSRIASNKKIFTVAFDIDAVAVEKNYLHAKKAKETFILPLLQDITNPSPNIGFMNAEKISFQSRTKADLTMVLALLPHLTIKHGIYFEDIAKFLKTLAPNLIIEFIPSDDKKVKEMLSRSEGNLMNYSEEKFIKAFEKYFNTIEKKPVADTKRTLYLMKVKE